MSCCPAAPDIQVAEVNPDEPSQGAEVQRLPGESEDCFMARSGNVSETGQVDDKTEPIADKIQQNSVVTDGSAYIHLQFTVNGPRVATSWTFAPASFPGVTMSSGGLMDGTFDPSVQKTKLTVRVQAIDGAGIIDDRTYDFSPSVYNGSSSITLTHPLPGSIITCKFGPRKPPVQGASSDHKGIDMAYGGGTTKDVLCAADGEVVLARPGTGYGNYVMVKHLDAGGKHLITTLYAHLDSIYVKLGQKVVGGQSVGKEGHSGIGSGAHLHFEVRLPNDTKVDPMPYLQGAVVVANGVTPNNQPDGTGTTPATDGGKGVTAAEVAARTSCAAFGPSYEGTAPPSTVPAAPAGNPFDKAWFFTMQHEVNSLWNSAADRSPTSEGVAPGNPDIDAGLIDTPARVQRVGFVDHPKDPGGATKFGVAQRYNPKIKITDMPYVKARETGYNVYWLASQNNCGSMSSVKVAVMAFDMNYLLGPGGSKQVLSAAGATGAETGAAELAALDSIHAARIAYLKARPGDRFKTFGRGWTRRAEECLAYAKTV
jgi:murein DD-endopeptidase MepM/ murein hydrolase activator NlpD